jgi:glycerol-3-phosphate acyltransferase PlsY
MMPTIASHFWIPLVAYMLGSLPFGLWLAKLFGGTDIREQGSGNIGASNVTRVVGPLPGILTLILDATKGAFAVWLAGRFMQRSDIWMMAAGLCALMGHCFPIWLKFKGGKGVATALGVFLVICPLAALCRLALLVARLPGCGRSHAAPHAFSVGAAIRATLGDHFWDLGRLIIDSRQAPGQHSQTDPGN